MRIAIKTETGLQPLLKSFELIICLFVLLKKNGIIGTYYIHEIHVYILYFILCKRRKIPCFVGVEKRPFCSCKVFGCVLKVL